MCWWLNNLIIIQMLFILNKHGDFLFWFFFWVCVCVFHDTLLSLSFFIYLSYFITFLVYCRVSKNISHDWEEVIGKFKQNNDSRAILFGITSKVVMKSNEYYFVLNLSRGIWRLFKLYRYSSFPHDAISIFLYDTFLQVCIAHCIVA